MLGYVTVVLTEQSFLAPEKLHFQSLEKSLWKQVAQDNAPVKCMLVVLWFVAYNLLFALAALNFPGIREQVIFNSISALLAGLSSPHGTAVAFSGLSPLRAQSLREQIGRPISVAHRRGQTALWGVFSVCVFMCG